MAIVYQFTLQELAWNCELEDILDTFTSREWVGRAVMCGNNLNDKANAYCPERERGTLYNILSFRR